MTTSGSIPIPVEVVGGADTLATLLRIASALETTGKAAETAAPRARAFGDTIDAVGRFSQRLNSMAELAGRIGAVADRIADLAAEQARLDRVSEQTGLDLDAAAAAAGRFADETEAASAAGRLFQAGTELTQQQLNALMRVAGAASHTLGVDTSTAVEMLTSGLLNGSARGLRPFGADLAAAAGHSHTMTDRLTALVTQAQHTTSAVDDAHDAVARFRDSIEDAQRTVASAFATEFARLSTLGTSMNDAADGADEFNTNLRAVGQTAALIVSGLANGVGAVLGFIGTGIGTLLAGVGSIAAAMSALARGDNPMRAASRFMSEHTGADSIVGQLGRFTSGRVDALDNLAGDTLDPRTTAPTPAPARRPTRPPREGGGGGSAGSEDPYASLRERVAGEDEIIQEDRRLRVERRNLEEQIAKARAQEAERRMERERALMREQRARDNANQMERDERVDARSDEGIRDRARKDVAARREERELDRRYQANLGFTERMEDLSHRRITASQEEAEFVVGAFNAMGRAFSDHLIALVEGREELGTALQGMLSDTLKAISQEAAVKAGLNLAEGFAALATYRYDAAGEHFAAAGIYTAVAGLAGVGAAVTAPSTPGASTGQGRAANDNARSATPMSGGAGGSVGATVINVAFNGPQYGTGGVVQAAREIVGVINRGAVQGAVQINHLALGGAR